MEVPLRSPRLRCLVVTCLLLSVRTVVFGQSLGPSGGTDDPLPVEMFNRRTLHQPPPLTGTGRDARRNTLAFLEWAGQSAPAERDDARLALAGASTNDAVAKVLCGQARRFRFRDGTRSLLALSLLGELRNLRVGMPCLMKFARLKAPRRGKPELESGEPPRVTSLAMLQAKAVDGLAYQHDATADTEVLRLIREHPHRAVRAEAIEAYLWNHGNSPEARSAAGAAVLPDEAIFLDRIRREDGEAAATFDAKLDSFLRAHPELDAPTEDGGGATPPKVDPPETPVSAPVDGFAFGPTCGRTAPSCGGTCDGRQICVADPAAGCLCKDVCGDTAPACNGACGIGACATSPTGGGCYCAS